MNVFVFQRSLNFQFIKLKTRPILLTDLTETNNWNYEHDD